MCYFTQVQFPESTGYVDLRPWMDSTPITLSHGSSMQVAVQLFEKLVPPRHPSRCYPILTFFAGSALRIVNFKGIFNGTNYEKGCH